ncbi:MAG: MATE family efflux transporter [Lentisphaeria bacterium]|nr:MATE family efflux transporter [Lentisphaeria bacterium]
MQKKQKKAGKYTVGSIKITMLKTAFAMLAGTLALSGYNIADTYFVGRLPGSDALAAMGFTFPVIMLVGCLFRGVAIGMVTPMAHSLGAGKHIRSATLVTYGFLLMLTVSLIMMIFGIAFGYKIFSLFGAKGTTLELTIGYMNIWFFGCVTSSMCMAGNDLMIATGDNKIASMMMIIGMVINVILDPIFIFGWGFIPAMGVKGAALTTVCSQFICSLVLWKLIIKRHHLLNFKNLELRQLRNAWQIIIKFAIPAVIGMLLIPVGSTILTRIVAHFGDIAVAAVAAVNRLESVAFVIPMALGMTLMPMIAQNYGAGLYERIDECRRFAMRFAFVFLMMMAVIFFLVSDWVAVKFSTEAEVQKLIALGLKIIPWGLAWVEIHRFSGFFYTGTGHPHKSAWLNAMRIIGFTIPFSLIALHYQSILGIFWARFFADTLSGVIGFILARKLTKGFLKK